MFGGGCGNGETVGVLDVFTHGRGGEGETDLDVVDVEDTVVLNEQGGQFVGFQHEIVAVVLLDGDSAVDGCMDALLLIFRRKDAFQTARNGDEFAPRDDGRRRDGENADAVEGERRLRFRRVGEDGLSFGVR